MLSTLPDLAGVEWDREKTAAACVGILECLVDRRCWRTGPGTWYRLYKRPDTGRCMDCRKGETWRVFGVKTVNGELWCRLTPPPSCVTAGTAPALWVCAAGCGHLARPAPMTPAAG